MSSFDPDWNYWKQIPEAQLMECVLLSLGANPNEFRPHWLNDLNLQDRLEIAIAHVEAGTLPARRPSRQIVTWQQLHDAATDPHRVKRNNAMESIVSLPVFAKWASTLEWEVPEPMLKLATGPTWKERLMGVFASPSKLKSQEHQPPLAILERDNSVLADTEENQPTIPVNIRLEQDAPNQTTTASPREAQPPQASTNTSYDITSTKPRTAAANAARQATLHARKEAVAAAVERVLEITTLPREAFPYSRKTLAETMKAGYLSLNLPTEHATILNNKNITPSMIESDLKNCNIVFSGGNPSSLRPLATLLTPQRS